VLPLCTSVTLLRLFASAYLMARRTSRFVPVGEIGLIPTPESQRICFFPSFNISLLRNSSSFFASAHGSCQLHFNRHTEIANRVHRIAGQPLLERIKRFFAREHFEPRHPPLPAIRLLHGGVKHAPRRFPDVSAGPVPFDKRNDRRVRHLQLAPAITDRLAVGGNGLAVVRTLHERGSLE